VGRGQYDLYLHGQTVHNIRPAPDVTNSYSTTDFIQVTLTTVNPLPANLPLIVLTSGVVSLQMTDGSSGPSVDPLGYSIRSSSPRMPTVYYPVEHNQHRHTATSGMQTIFGTTFRMLPKLRRTWPRGRISPREPNRQALLT
jgi:hypothetical protein